MGELNVTFGNSAAMLALAATRTRVLHREGTMSARTLTYATTGTLVALSIAGFVDALVDDRNGPAAIFALIGIGVLALARLRIDNDSVVVRRDLMSWMERTSPATGETVEEMNNRAVSRLRAGFVPLQPEDQQ